MDGKIEFGKLSKSQSNLSLICHFFGLNSNGEFDVDISFIEYLCIYKVHGMITQRTIYKFNPDHKALLHHTLCSAISPKPKRYAIIGAGFAGVATAWHLLSRSTSYQPIHVEVYDAYGLAAGGSGAAAGLLHPYTPKGKVLWKGLEAYKEALHLIEAAENAVNLNASSQRQDKSTFVWRHGMLRPPKTKKQAREFLNNVNKDIQAAEFVGARCIDYKEMTSLVDGLSLSLLDLDTESIDETKENVDKKSGIVGLYTARTLVLHPLRYLEALWKSCTAIPCSSAALHVLSSSPTSSSMLDSEGESDTSETSPNQTLISSLTDFEREHGRFDAIIVAAGAALDTIEEARGLLPLDLCQGYSLHMTSNGGESPAEHRRHNKSTLGNTQEENRMTCAQPVTRYPDAAPSLLGNPYLAMHGNTQAIVGATQQHDVSIDVAASLLDPANNKTTPSSSYSNSSNTYSRRTKENDPSGRVSDGSRVGDDQHLFEAVHGLKIGASSVWPPLSSWSVSAVRSGVRAIPSRTESGSIPYLGRFRDKSAPVRGDGDGDGATGRSEWWLVCGLGARGLVYHAWLGKLLAEAVLQNSEENIPRELLRWKV